VRSLTTKDAKGHEGNPYKVQTFVCLGVLCG
jgi:hypothetical protein